MATVNGPEKGSQAALSAIKVFYFSGADVNREITGI